jgi:enoyl-[acyl-carrier protein] reductase II
MNLKLQQLIEKGNQFLGTNFPIICGAMTWVSNHRLVASVSNNGCFGVIASGSMTPELLKNEIQLTKNLTNRNFGVNLITMHPKLEEMIETCIQSDIKYLIFAGSMAKIPRDLITKIKEHGVKIMTFAPSLTIANGLIRLGFDAIILEGMEAGGHIGPVSTTVLAQEILPYMPENVPIFVGGGIGHGFMIGGLLEIGAAGVQLGSKFVCSYDSPAHPNFKQKFIQSSSRDAVVSVQVDEDFYVIPVRSIKNKAHHDFIKYQHEIINQYKSGKLEKDEAQLKIEHYWAGALRKAVIYGDIENGSLMAGQSVGMVKKEQSTKEIVDDLIRETENFFSK